METPSPTAKKPSSRSKRVNVVRKPHFSFLCSGDSAVLVGWLLNCHGAVQEVPEMLTEIPSPGAQPIMHLRGRMLGKGGFAAVYELQNMQDGTVLAGKVGTRTCPQIGSGHDSVHR